ncbi:uncharacterized protein LOC106977942 isoform X1 [Acinonyx jubatus]|uniref:Uncharacterized protein LOC106977942 isoform X1 n=1 Tax=Acinonyx jubatus TaxID=32536 RepID=A0ABM3NZZ5_ACIJB|nr:uncharacterized protein LOC106977942 isoform X1 [Acinonyx jubatus]
MYICKPNLIHSLKAELELMACIGGAGLGVLVMVSSNKRFLQSKVAEVPNLSDIKPKWGLLPITGCCFQVIFMVGPQHSRNCAIIWERSKLHGSKGTESLKEPEGDKLRIPRPRRSGREKIFFPISWRRGGINFPDWILFALRLLQLRDANTSDQQLAEVTDFVVSLKCKHSPQSLENEKEKNGRKEALLKIQSAISTLAQTIDHSF